MLRLETKNLTKWFGGRQVFSDISFNLSPGESIAIIGPNGSGKTTLIKSILGLIPLSRGKVSFLQDEKKLDFDSYRKKVALIAPYLNLYDNLTAQENLRFLSMVNGMKISNSDIDNALETVGLDGRGEDYVGAYSSGMKQRLKYALTIIRNPEIIYLDEPTSNLDEAGKQVVFNMIRNYRNDAIMIIATNEKEEYTLAEQQCQLGG